MRFMTILYTVGWCVVEWVGENTFDCLSRNKITAMNGEDPLFEEGEEVLAVYRGKPYKAVIASAAGIIIFWW